MNNNIIYRQDAINSIKELPRWIMDPKGEFQSVDPPTVSMIDPEDAMDAIEKLSPAQQEPQWIPCSERLPDEKDVGRALKELGIEKRSEYVLATVEVKGERITVTACTYDGKWDWDMKYVYPDFKVVAWMPLPSPYRAERREE